MRLYTTEPSNYDKRVHGSWYALFGPDGSLAVDRAEVGRGGGGHARQRAPRRTMPKRPM